MVLNTLHIVKKIQTKLIIEQELQAAINGVSDKIADRDFFRISFFFKLTRARFSHDSEEIAILSVDFLD